MPPKAGLAGALIRRRPENIFPVSKSHTIKNVLLAGKQKKIVYLSQSYESRVPDKKIADEAPIEFEQKVALFQDKGFPGVKPKNPVIIMPDKKPKGKELTDAQKQQK